MRFTSYAKALACVSGAIILSGCLNGADTEGQRNGFLSGLSRDSEPAISGQTSRTMADGDIIARAPDAYCFDPSVTRSDRFALVAECGTLGSSPQADPLERGLLTISISSAAPSAAVEVTLSGDLAGAVASTAVDGLRLQQITADSAPIAGADSTYWRGVMPVNNRILVLSAYAPVGGSIRGSAGQALIEDFAAKTRKASPKVKTPLFAGKPASAPQENAQELRFGAIGRLFQRNQSDTQ